MPRNLTFKSGRSTFEAELVKIDRTKVYGSVEILTEDHEGAEVELLTLARDGRTLIESGGTGAGYVNSDGYWVETGERIPVNAEGDPLELIESSFDAPIPLKDTVAEEVLLDHPIRLAYHLETTGAPAALLKRLAAGAIFHFAFSYRGGPVADPAFVLTDTDGDLWLLVGNAADVDFRDYKQVAVCCAAAEEEVEDDDEADNFDFDML